MHGNSPSLKYATVELKESKQKITFCHCRPVLFPVVERQAIGNGYRGSSDLMQFYSYEYIKF